MHVLEVRVPHLSFMFLKEHWFRELYLGLKVTASFDRSESYTRVIDGQVRCITQKLSRRTYRSSGTFSLSLFLCPHGCFLLFTTACVGKASASAIRVQSVRPTWFEDFAVPKGPAPQTDQGQPQPLHGLKLVIKEEALPLKEQPEFPALLGRPF